MGDLRLADLIVNSNWAECAPLFFFFNKLFLLSLNLGRVYLGHKEDVDLLDIAASKKLLPLLKCKFGGLFANIWFCLYLAVRIIGIK